MEHRTDAGHKIEMLPSPAYPGIEFRLRGWTVWKNHMLSLTPRSIVGFHEDKPRFALMTNDPKVMALSDEAKMDLILKVAQQPVPRLETPREYVAGVIRYLKWWWKYG